MDKLEINLTEEEKKRIIFLGSKLVNSREDIIETGAIILTALRRSNNENMD